MHQYEISKTMNLPNYCLYVLKYEMLECPKEDGVIELITIVHGSSFEGFTENLSEEEVDDLSSYEKPTIVNIEDFNIFQKGQSKLY
jgi:hypothetical protein